MELSAELSAQMRDELPQIPQEELRNVVERWLHTRRSNNIDLIGSPSLTELCEVLLPPSVHIADLRYFAMSSIRRRYGVTLSSSTAAIAHYVASTVSQLFGRPMTYDVLMSEIQDSLNKSRYREVSSQVLGVFTGICRVLDLIDCADGSKNVTLRPECGNAEFLINQLFAVPTSIPGFDALLGGGGLILTDAPSTAQKDSEATANRQEIGGRSVLCIGPFGSGKTLLSLQFAVEIARKGGVAWIVALEQTEEECLYALESLGVSTHNPAFVFVRGGLTDSFLTLADPTPARGALVFLRPAPQETNYSTFIDIIEKRLSWMRTYPLRLLVVDPVNAFLVTGEPGSARAKTRKMFESAKQANVNVWFTSEHVEDKLESDRFAENIADTVIHLGSNKVLGQQRRYIEITKSRFQQEASGQHGFVISHGGVQVYPSTTQVSQLMSSPHRRRTESALSFGVPGVEQLMGPSPILPGDIVILAGPGKGKTLFGARFLLGEKIPGSDECSSVFVSDYSRIRLARFLRTIAGDNGDHAASTIELCPLPTGFVEPGRILYEIQLHLEKNKRASKTRVLLTNLSRWEEEMPLVSEDASFGIALVTLIRSYNASAVIVCGDALERGSRLRDAMFDQADVFFQFDKRDFQGRSTTLISAVKTRGMQHQREPFELVIDHGGVRLRPAPLFRTDSAGNSRALRVSLFLHAETQNHKEHNAGLMEGLRAIISPRASIAAQDRRFDPGLLAMSQYSAVDELQIFQIDEFQLPSGPAAVFGSGALCSFSEAIHGEVLKDRLRAFRERVTFGDDGRFFAVPFYANLSFFSVQQKKLHRLGAKRFPESWEELANLCEDWDRNSKQKDMLFHCAVYEQGVETYNCMFFEILYSLQRPSRAWLDDLSLWLDQPSAIHAAYLFRALCRRGHKRQGARQGHPSAIISRHWYNTLNQALSHAKAEERAEVEVRPLFGGLTTAGEWYLAIPSHSAAPEVGLSLIGHMTSPDRETQRVELGVGLPTREVYYQVADSGDTSISKYFRFNRPNVYALLKNAIRRSNFRSYQRLSNTMSSHLQWILDIPEPKSAKNREQQLRAEITRAMLSLVSNIRFLLRSDDSADR